MTKTYLGDGVYAEFTEQGLVLTTETGLAVTNTIVLEIEVLSSLIDFLQRWRKESQEAAANRQAVQDEVAAMTEEEVREELKKIQKERDARDLRSLFNVVRKEDEEGR